MISSAEYFDAVIVGAGVAGASAAAILSQAGSRVLLLEKSSWPREKVCGCCLSAAAVSALRKIGCDAVVCDAIPLDRVVWHFQSRALSLSLPGGAAISRARLDTAIVGSAVDHGCEFLSSCRAILLPADQTNSFRELELNVNQEKYSIRAGVVIAADGISGTLLAREPWARWSISPNSWIGASGSFAETDGPPPGQIHMLVGEHGYVGLVQMESALHLAASLDPAACKSCSGPAQLIADILRSCGRDPPADLKSAHLHGTGLLTRHRQMLGGHRVLAIGDACGYVEPFTGEGMAWAITSAIESSRLLLPIGSDWPVDLPARWQNRYLEIIGHRQRWCRAMRPTMHRPFLARGAIRIGSVLPNAAQWIADIVGRTKEIRDDYPGRFPVSQIASRIDARDPRHRRRQPPVRPAGIDA